VKGFVLTRVGVGTIIGRKSVSKGKEYRRIWIYVPTKVAEDTSFKFKVGEPCLVEIDTGRGWLIIKPISVEEAKKLGWTERLRKRG
jgi:hypothetical protein